MRIFFPSVRYIVSLLAILSDSERTTVSPTMTSTCIASIERVLHGNIHLNMEAHNKQYK
jgi:hypothetical protein